MDQCDDSTGSRFQVPRSAFKVQVLPPSVSCLLSSVFYVIGASGTSASTGIPCLSTPERLSTLIRIR